MSSPTLRQALASAAVSAGVVGGATVPLPVAADTAGVPVPAAVAYVDAARSAPCAMDWRALAAVRSIESPASIGDEQPDGTVTPRVFGPDLDGSSAAIGWMPDTDDGVIDGTDQIDRAVGPFQFIPSTARMIGRDPAVAAHLGGPLDDAALAERLHHLPTAAFMAGVLLCRNGWTLGDPLAEAGALEAYNGTGPAAREYAATATARIAELPAQVDTTGLAPGFAAVADNGDRPNLAAVAGRAIDWAWGRAYDGWSHVGRVVIRSGTAPTVAGWWITADQTIRSAGGAPRSAPKVTTASADAGVVLVEVPTVDGSISVSEMHAPSLAALIAAAARDGVQLTGSGWRSSERQAELRIENGCPDVWTAPSWECETPTAIPGRSAHEKGAAVDVADTPGAWEWLARNDGRRGWCLTVVDAAGVVVEPWHIEPCA